MSEPVRITVTVAADGQVIAQTHETVGEQCLPYIQVLEDLLEATTIDSNYTTDWWKTAGAQVNTHRDEVTQHAPAQLNEPG